MSELTPEGQLKIVPPLFTDYGDILAEVETGVRTHMGEIWVMSNWLNVNEATALRDWLNRALP